MPFTFSHPIAAVPFARCGLPLSALVVGSLAPDFPYFLQLSTGNQFGHSLAGLFLFCVPAGLVALWLWHQVLDVPLRSLLPVSIQRKMPRASKPFSFWPLKQLSLITCALVIGATTHIVWDAFTHANGFVVRHWSLLREPLFATSHGALPVFKVLQHGSSLGGAIALWWLCRRAMRHENVFHDDSKTNAHLVVLMLFFAAVCATFWTFTKSSDGALQNAALQTRTRDFIVSFIATLLVELTAWSVWWHGKRRA